MAAANQLSNFVAAANYSSCQIFIIPQLQKLRFHRVGAAENLKKLQIYDIIKGWGTSSGATNQNLKIFKNYSIISIEDERRKQNQIENPRH